MNKQPDPESIVRQRLDELKDDPPPDPRVVARARARFLAQAVSADELQRQKGWKSIFSKEQFAMNLLMSVLVIASLFVAGGTTVQAAQNDLPGQPLYGVKIWSEDVSLKFQTDSEARVDHLMELAQTRVQEMSRLVETGQTPPDQVRQRLEQHLEQALQLCSDMGDAALDPALLRLHNQLRQQDQDMQRLQIHAAQETQPILERTRIMLQTQLSIVDEGLQNHEMFRNSVRNGFQYGQTQTPPTPIPSSTPPASSGQQNGQSTPQAGPDNGNGPGPNPDPGMSDPGATAMPDNGGSGSGSGNNSGGKNGGSNSGGNNPEGNGSEGSGAGGSGSGGKKP